MMDLSILICSLNTRWGKLEALTRSLESQIWPAYARRAEVLVETDGGETPVGAKRNTLLKRAAGDYVVFVDDDDTVAETYVADILRAIDHRPDCVNMIGKIWWGGKWKEFRHSIRYAVWYEEGGVYYRCPNHLNPVRRQYALAAGFPPALYIGEDKAYSQRLYQLLRGKHEARVNKPIYFYQPSEAAA